MYTNFLETAGKNSGPTTQFIHKWQKEKWKSNNKIKYKSEVVSYRVHYVTNMQVAVDFTIRKHNVCNDKQQHIASFFTIQNCHSICGPATGYVYYSNLGSLPCLQWPSLLRVIR